MKLKFLPYLVDPLSGQPLEITTLEGDGDRTIAGILHTSENWYPIISGIPRMLVGQLKTELLQRHHDFFKQWSEQLPPIVKTDWQRAIDQIKDFNQFLEHQQKTADSFAFEWKKIYQENDFERNNFLHFVSPFLAQYDFKGKLVVDIGCGSGRFTKQAASLGGQVVFGTDLGESVEVAYALTKEFDNVCIVQADIYQMPFRNVFDIAISIGVLHHLPNPQEGFSKLPRVLKSGGKMLIWVYNRRNNKRALYLYEPLRSMVRNLPPKVLLRMCYAPAAVVQGFNVVSKTFQAYGAKQIAKKIPFSYYANFPFNMKLNDAFDVLATPKRNYYFAEDIRDWFSGADLQEVESHEHSEAGITCIGTSA